MIDCILLSAGESSRFGSPKALAIAEGKTIIERTQETILSSNINNIIIVLGAHAESIRPFVLKHKRVKVVYNNHYNFGQTSSFKCGLLNVDPKVQGVFLLPVDFPCINAETFNILINEFHKEKSKIIIPIYNGRKGHPPLFHVCLKPDFLSLDNSQGINSVNHKYAKQTTLLPTNDRGVLLSFNTKEEWEEIKQKQQQKKEKP